MRRARCRSFPELDWHSEDADTTRACIAICRTCTVRARCALTAIGNQDPWGIWGGLTPDERDALAEAIGVVESRVLPDHGTDSRYANHGCRCSRCRAAHSAYERRRRRLR